MAIRNPSWAVVATVDEHPSVVQTFVAWYVSLGTSAIYLYFDRPNDPAADLFGDVPQVQVFRCDADHWQQRCKRRPARHQVRQVQNATHAFGIADADWLLHCDGDEYLHPARRIAEILATTSATTEGLLVPVAERRFFAGAQRPHIFTGAFRRPEKKGVRVSPMTKRGLTGHAMGKAFVRTDADLNISIHRPRRNDEILEIPLMPDVELLHFDGLTTLQWIEKLLRKADMQTNHGGAVPTTHRQNQIDRVLRHPPDAIRVHDQVKVLDPDDIADLQTRGLFLDIAFEPRDAMQAVFGFAELLTPEAYDAWLLENRAERVPHLAKIGKEKRPPYWRPSSWFRKS